jgi:tetratricopeptide (TPR) repeat protein
MAKLNAEVDTVTAARYRVKSYPTILVLDKNGKEFDRVVGYYRPAEFMTNVNDYLAGRNTLAALAAAEPDSGHDPGYLYRLAERYNYHGLYDQSRKYYKRVVEADPKNVSELSDDALYYLSRMSQKDKDYAAARAYAQQVIDRYPKSDAYKAAILQLAGNWKRDGKLSRARTIYLDYAKRFPADEDAPWAKEQADTLGLKIQRGEGA